MNALIGIWVAYTIVYGVALGAVSDFDDVKRIRDLGLGLKFFGLLWCLYTLIVVIKILGFISL